MMKYLIGIFSLALVYHWVFPSGNTHHIEKRNACLRNVSKIRNTS